jgi:hypothetical protein
VAVTTAGRPAASTPPSPTAISAGVVSAGVVSAGVVSAVSGVIVVVFIWFEEICSVEEGAFFGADVDERRLHSRQNRFNSAEVDVPYCSGNLRAVM